LFFFRAFPSDVKSLSDEIKAKLKPVDDKNKKKASKMLERKYVKNQFKSELEVLLEDAAMLAGLERFSLDVLLSKIQEPEKHCEELSPEAGRNKRNVENKLHYQKYLQQKCRTREIRSRLEKEEKERSKTDSESNVREQ
jgi:hypothetical protein